MNNFYNNEDDFLRHKLMEHEFEMLPQAWDKMSTLLDSQPVAVRRTAGYYWWGLCIAALIIGAASGGYFYKNNQFTPEPVRTTPVSVVPIASTTNATQNVVSGSSTKQVSSKIASALPSATKDINATQVLETKSGVVKNTTTSSQLSKSSKPKKQKLSKVSVIEPMSTPKPPNTNHILEEEASTASAMLSVPTEKERYPVLKRRTEIIRQYSSTPLRILQQRRRVGTFGIQTDVDFKKSPVTFSAVVGASAQLPAISPKKIALRPVVGAYVETKLAKHHSLQAGIQYKNLAVDAAPRLEHTTYTTNQSEHQAHYIKGLNLLEFPVVYKVHPHPKYNIQAGIKPAVLLGVDSDIKKEVNLKQADLGLSSWDLGVLLGMEYAFNKNWTVGVQYTLGVLNMAQKANALYAADKNNSLVTDPLPAQYINKEQELLIPVDEQTNTTHYLRVPKQIKNSDLQLLLKYNF